MCSKYIFWGKIKWDIIKNNYILFLLLPPPTFVRGKITWAGARNNCWYEGFMPSGSCLSLHHFQSHVCILICTNLYGGEVLAERGIRQDQNVFCVHSSQGNLLYEHFGTASFGLKSVDDCSSKLLIFKRRYQFKYFFFFFPL